MSLKTPVVILNFKTYLESSGKKAMELAEALESAGEESGVTMVAVPQAIDIYRIKDETNIPVFSQHIDAVSPGGHTGSNLFESFVASGIDGTLLNHSECRMTLADIAEIVKKTKEAELISCVCTNNIAVEPPELIGTGIPVSKADPEVVEGSVSKVKAINKDVKVLCGAGISTGEDMAAAIELGAEGVLLASGIIKAESPKDALLDLVSKI